jgi:hypothetical protein
MTTATATRVSDLLQVADGLVLLLAEQGKQIASLSISPGGMFGEVQVQLDSDRLYSNDDMIDLLIAIGASGVVLGIGRNASATGSIGNVKVLLYGGNVDHGTHGEDEHGSFARRGCTACGSC